MIIITIIIRIIKSLIRINIIISIIGVISIMGSIFQRRSMFIEILGSAAGE